MGKVIGGKSRFVKRKENYHSQLIHGKEYLQYIIRMVSKITKDINPKYPQSFLTSILRTVGANFCVKSLAQMSRKYSSLQKGLMTTKNVCESLQKSDVNFKKKRIKRDTQE